ETKGGDVSAFIPTNVISITDGQIYLETDLFFQGVRPAINVGISVSRVGGNAQIKAMKSVSGTMRLDLAQYRELEAFAQFGSELDRASQAQLDRGVRVVEILKQPQFQPVSVEDQVVTIWAVSNGKLDDVPVADIRRFETELREHLHSRSGDLLDSIRSKGTLDDEARDQLGKAVDDFRSSFETSQQSQEREPGHTDDLATLGSDDSDRETDDADTPDAGGDDRSPDAGPIADTDAQPAP
ncbi:MAG: hypothetical protein M3425_04655, partial [Actinomycetota bacterium]|nr:hypothetical protein [Actinomycetota bacterium]